MDKKGFMRTLEVAIAAVITFIFVIYLIPDINPKNQDNSIELMASLKNNPDFLSCASDKDTECVKSIIRSNLPNKYDFTLLISTDPKKSVEDLPEVQVYVDSIFLSGSENVVVKIYYWVR